MITEKIHINDSLAFNYLIQIIKNVFDFKQANELLFEHFGIVDFFENHQEFYCLKNK